MSRWVVVDATTLEKLEGIPTGTPVEAYRQSGIWCLRVGTYQPNEGDEVRKVRVVRDE